MLSLKIRFSAIATAAFALAPLAEIGFAQQSDSGIQQPAPVPIPVPQLLRDYQPVTDQRLKNPEDGNWLMIRRTYDGWGYSPLAEITPENVKRLRPVWIFSTGESRV